MPTTKTLDHLKLITDQFTPEVLGVFWITNQTLSRELAGFEEFNYLFDGLISQYLYGQAETKPSLDLNKSNIFFTNNFNQRLFLAHLKMNETAGAQGVASVLDEQIAVIQSSKTENRKTILILNQTEKNWGSDLEKRYPQFIFKSLVLPKE